MRVSFFISGLHCKYRKSLGRMRTGYFGYFESTLGTFRGKGDGTFGYFSDEKYPFPLPLKPPKVSWKFSWGTFRGKGDRVLWILGGYFRVLSEVKETVLLGTFQMKSTRFLYLWKHPKCLESSREVLSEVKEMGYFGYFEGTFGYFQEYRRGYFWVLSRWKVPVSFTSESTQSTLKVPVTNRAL